MSQKSTSLQVGSLVRVSRDTNDVWEGLGIVVYTRMDDLKPSATLRMITGRFKGENGGFLLDQLEVVPISVPQREMLKNLYVQE